MKNLRYLGIVFIFLCQGGFYIKLWIYTHANEEAFFIIYCLNEHHFSIRKYPIESRGLSQNDGSASNTSSSNISVPTNLNWELMQKTNN